MALASLLLLAGCGDEDATDPSAEQAASTSGDGSASASPPADARQYVALGDSFTAAPLVPETDPDDPCLRSSNNYPALVAAAVPDLELTDVSCSGAESASLIGVQQIGSDSVLPQFDALSDDTDLVTVSIGGNDFGFFGSLLADCASSSDVEADGQPCTDAVADGTKKDLTTILPDLEARVGAVLTGVAGRAPNAEVILVGYPRLMPTDGTCDELAIAAGDLDYTRRLDEGLGSAMSGAAAAAGVTYVDAFAASEGHDICSDDPWVNGKDTIPDRALAFHPFAAEQQALADLIVADLT